MRIRRPCNDSFGECTAFCNGVRYREYHKKAEVESDDDGDCDDDEEQEKRGFKYDEIMYDLVKSFISGDCLEQECILESAGFHVKQVNGI
jgi:hypothetical protein